jgi:AraC-like DNA-binding protein
MNHEIQTATYITKTEFLEPQLLLFEREHHYAPPQSEIDVFGNFWVLGFSSLNEGALSFSRFGTHPLSGKIGVLIPPYSIVEWVLQSTRLNWTALIWPADKLKLSLTEPIAFRWQSHNSLPNCFAHIEEQVSNLANTIPIGKLNQKSALANEAKQLLDQELGEELTIGDLAQRLSVEAHGLTRVFKKTFGITPIIYRNKQRVIDSMFHLLFNHEQNISDIGFNVGFADLSRFNKEFKKYTLAKPSQYQTKRLPT